jgi:hypothetical protein
MRLICTYRPPNLNKNDNEIFVETLSEYLFVDYPIILSVDLNYPDFNSPLAKSFFEICESASLTQMVNQPTRGAHILDLVFTNIPETISNLTINLPFAFSDHSMVNFCSKFLSVNCSYYLFWSKIRLCSFSP